MVTWLYSWRNSFGYLFLELFHEKFISHRVLRVGNICTVGLFYLPVVKKPIIN